MRSLTLVAALVVLALTTRVASAELITNGDFENPEEFFGWIQINPNLFQFVDPSSGDKNADDENTAGATFFLGDGFSGIEQQIATVSGQTYELTFSLRNTQAADPPDWLNEMIIKVNGTALLLPAELAPNMPDFEYAPFSLTFDAPTDNVFLTFLFRNDLGIFDLDNVSVVDPSANPVPEPASLVLWSLTALGGSLVVRRRRRAASVIAG